MSKTKVVVTYSDGRTTIIEGRQDRTIVEVTIDGRRVFTGKSLDGTIPSLDLSNRTNHCLSRAGIHSIAELLARSEQDLLLITNFGDKCLGEVVKKLDDLGLCLSSTDYEGSSRK